MGKTVEEVETKNQNVVDTTNTITSKTSTPVMQNTTKNTKQENTVTKQETTKQEKKQEKTSTETLTFVKPVEGEISKDYAKEQLDVWEAGKVYLEKLN